MAVLDYFTVKKGQSKTKDAMKSKEKPAATATTSEEVRSPVLNDEEEKFLRRIAEEGTPPPLPERPHHATDPGLEEKTTLHGADQIALPTSPPPTDLSTQATPIEAEKKLERENTDSEQKKKNRTSWYATTLARSNSIFGKAKDKAKDKKDEVKASKEEKKAEKKKGKEVATVPTIEEPEKDIAEENKELTNILDQLNLSAVNNRVFSFSKESAELLDKFKVILQDLVNGVPTAYDDLEKLLKGSEEQLNKLYEGLPPFLQSLIKQLPTKITAALGPEILAAAAEKPSLGTAAASTKKKRSRQIPSLKKLISVDGAIATMLRSILNFLKLRFPAFMTGTNMLLSLAVFILLFVFWYCHKRGRETRLEREKVEGESAANSESDMEDSIILTPTNYYEESRKRKTEEQREQSSVGAAPITIHDDSVDQRPVSPRVENLPSVLDLPEPATVPLPKEEKGPGDENKKD